MKNKSLIYSLLLIFVVKVSLVASNNKFLNVSNGIIENKGQVLNQNGQINAEVKYLFSLPGVNISFKANGFSYNTYYMESNAVGLTEANGISNPKRIHPKIKYSFHRVDIEFIGANLAPQIVAENPFNDTYNFNTSVSSGNNIVGIKAYQKITYKNIYPKIDLEFMSDGNKLKYNFILHYGADINVIKWVYKGANKTSLAENKIKISVRNEELIEKIPESFIKGYDGKLSRINISYNKSNDDVYGFVTDHSINLNSNDALIIDPTLTMLWSTYYGGSGLDRLWSSCFDNVGNTYYTGFVASTNAIATTGAYQSVFGGGPFDVAILKFDAAGNRIWATYYGGSGDDEGYGITIDKLNNLYVTGFTSSSTSIASIGSHQAAYGGGPYDCFLLKMSNTGALVWATYYGGSGDDQGYQCQVDTTGNIILSGQTSSTNSISTVGTQQVSYGGGNYDAFVAKFSANGVRLWSTYYGSISEDVGTGCTVDFANNIYLTGYTTSSISISTSGSHQVGYGGNKDAFLIKFNSNGIRKWATYYGGSGNEIAMPVVTDSLGYVYFGGVTNSIDSISSLGSHQPIYGGCATTTGCNGDAFLVKFDSLGNRQWGTYYGGTRDDGCYDIYTKGMNVYMCGTSMSQTGISTVNTYQDFNINQYVDMMLVKFTSSGVRLWGTYLGNFLGDFAYSVMIDPLGYIYLCGESDGSFPVTAGCYQSAVGGSIDGVIVKFRESAIGTGLENNFETSANFQIYPNPNSGSFTLQTKEDVVLEIVNELGQLIKTVKLDSSNNHLIIITGLADGVYCLKDKLSGSIIKNKIIVIK